MLDAFQPADTIEEWLSLIRKGPSGLILNEEQWREYVSSRNTESHPLRQINLNVIAEFNRSVQFRKEGGLATARYDILEKHLNNGRFYDVWASFGISRKLFASIQDQRKDTFGDCRYWPNWVCLDSGR